MGKPDLAILAEEVKAHQVSALACPRCRNRQADVVVDALAWLT